MGEGSILLSCSASHRKGDYEVAEEKSEDEGGGEMTHFEKRRFSNVEICV